MQLLSLNVWGAPWAKHRTARLTAIVERLQALQPDVIALQEVYLPQDRSFLREHLSEWEHQHYFASALVGSGLLTLSRYPIVEAAFHRFRLGGKPEAVTRGDYYAGKGIGLTRLHTPHGTIDVYNCHTHAQYDPANDNEYAVYNETNLYEAAQFINHYSSEHPAVLCGDLNTRPEQFGYRIISELAALSDAAMADDNVPADTFSLDNPYVTSFNQRLDYIFTRHMSVDTITVTFDESLNGAAAAYSDHYALLATLMPMDTSSDVNTVTDDIYHQLYEHVELALLRTENAQGGHIMHALGGMFSLFDIQFMTKFVREYAPAIAKRLQQVGIVAAIGYVIYHVLQAGINLQARKSTLQAIRDELKILMQSQAHT